MGEHPQNGFKSATCSGDALLVKQKIEGLKSALGCPKLSRYDGVPLDLVLLCFVTNLYVFQLHQLLVGNYVYIYIYTCDDNMYI